MNYQSRLNPETYGLDVVVSFSVVPDPRQVENPEGLESIDIPEKLFHRLMHLGHAYELHFAQVLDMEHETLLNSTQCQWFSDELVFLRAIVSDPATDGVLQVVLDKARQVASSEIGVSLLISPP